MGDRGKLKNQNLEVRSAQLYLLVRNPFLQFSILVPADTNKTKHSKAPFRHLSAHFHPLLLFFYWFFSLCCGISFLFSRWYIHTYCIHIFKDEHGKEFQKWLKFGGSQQAFWMFNFVVDCQDWSLLEGNRDTANGDQAVLRKARMVS